MVEQLKFVRSVILATTFNLFASSVFSQQLDNEQNLDQPILEVTQEIVDRALPQDPFDAFRQDRTYDEVDKEAYMARVEHEFVKNPHYYELVRDAYRNPEYAISRTEAALQRRHEEEKNARDTWTKSLNFEIGIGGELSTSNRTVNGQVGSGVSMVFSREWDSPERALYNLQQKRENEDGQIRKHMIDNYEEVKRISRKMADIDYKIAAGQDPTPEEETLWVVMNLIKEDSNNAFPYRAADKNALINTYEGLPANILKRIDEAETSEECAQIINEYKTEIIINRYPVDNEPLDESSDLEKVNDKITHIDEELAKDNISAERRESLQSVKEGLEKDIERILVGQHKKKMKGVHDSIYVVDQAARLLFPNDPHIQKSINDFKAASQIYDNVQTMALSNITTGGVGAVLAGFNMLSGGGRPSGADQAIINMLKDIIATLDEVQEAVEANSKKLDYQIKLISELKTQLKNMEERHELRFDQIARTMSDYYHSEEDRDTQFAQSELVFDLLTESKAVVEDILVGQDRIVRDDYSECMRTETPNDCSDDSRLMHDRVRNLFNRLYGTATLSLEDLARTSGNNDESPNMTDARFNPNKTMDSFNTEDHVESFYFPVESRTGALLPSMGRWLNEKIVSQEIEGVETVRESLLENVPHPSILDAIIKTYSSMAEYMHPYEGVSEDEGQLGTLERMTKRVSSASEEMRLKVLTARAVYISTLNGLLNQIDANLRSLASEERVHSEIKGSYGVLFSQLNESEIKSQLRNKSAEDFYRFTSGWDLFQSNIRETDTDERLPGHFFYNLKDFGGRGRIRLDYLFRPVEQYYSVLSGNEEYEKNNTILENLKYQSNIEYKYKEWRFDWHPTERDVRMLWGSLPEFNAEELHEARGNFIIDLRQHRDIHFEGKNIRITSNMNRIRDHFYRGEAFHIPIVERPIDQQSSTQKKEMFINIALKEIQSRHERVWNGLSDYLSNHESFTDIAKAQLILNTFVKAGYGEAYLVDENMDDFRSMEEQLSAIAKLLDEIRKAETLKDGLAKRALLEEKIDLLNSLDLTPTLPDNPTYALGFGDVEGSLEALDDVRSLKTTATLQPNP